MSRSADPGHFFQTSESIAQSERKAAKSQNKHGHPIRLRSKALACALDRASSSGAVYVATAGGAVEHVNLEAGEVDGVYAGPAAPLACLAVDHSSVFAGCWDRNVYAWRAGRGVGKMPMQPGGVHVGGHADFVKTVSTAVLGGRGLLITGGADATVVIWEVGTNRRLHVLKGHARGVQALAVDVVASTAEAIEFVSADSTNEIRRWRLTASSAEEVGMTASGDAGAPVTPLVAHETSVYALHFDADGDLWTASADKTAKCLVRGRQWEADTTLEHPDFVRDVLVDEDGGWVVTACRDEEIRVWERSTGKLFHTFSGHHDEVTGLVLAGRKLVSVSIDATVRTWGLMPDELRRAKEDARIAAEGTHEDRPTKTVSLLTEEEERELAELMGDDGDDGDDD